MATVIKGRRPVDPTRIEIEQRKAEVNAANGWDVPQRDPMHELNQLLLQQCDDQEDYRLPEMLPALAPEAVDVPREMSKADRCNVDIGSLFALNVGLDRFVNEPRYTIGDVDPETVDRSPDALADHLEASHAPLPPLKTQTAWQKPAERTHRDVRPFRTRK